jgi:tol-pal system protein YbgF
MKRGQLSWPFCYVNQEEVLIMKITKSRFLKLSCFIFSCSALPLLAQAPVSDVSTSHRRVEVVDDNGNSVNTYGASGSVEPDVGYSGTNRNRNNESQSDVNDNGVMFRQFQQLQEEVATLRGQLEEQTYEIQKLKQQHQDDFSSLDRRLSGGVAPAPVNSPQAGVSGPVNANAMSNSSQSANNSAPANADGKEEYEAAYALLKSKDYSGSSSAFKSFVNKYPKSDYAGNSWFWLGFVYQTQGDVDSAANAFSSLIERFPDHTKADDAKYNLGKIYNQQGKTEQARALLKQVADGNSKAAPLAKSYLETM